MPRILGLELSSVAFALRVVGAVLAALVTFVVFCFIPASLSTISSSYLPASVRSDAARLVSSFVSPILPDIGLALTVVVFVTAILKGTRAHGAVLVPNGLLFAAYTYVALHGGTISVTLPSGLPQQASGTITLDITLLMVLLLVPSLLTVVKGLATLATWEPPGPTRTSVP